jgi:hypothetical protein
MIENQYFSISQKLEAKQNGIKCDARSEIAQNLASCLCKLAKAGDMIGALDSFAAITARCGRHSFCLAELGCRIR